MRILHTGAKNIDPKAFKDVATARLNKPMSSDGRNAGFWGSTEYEKDGQFTSDWHEWTACEDFKCFDYGVSFELKPGTRILTVYDMKDFGLEVSEFNYACFEWMWTEAIDFKKLSEVYDAIHVTNQAIYSTRDKQYDPFYAYDAESWIIFRPDVIDFDSIIVREGLATPDREDDM